MLQAGYAIAGANPERQGWVVADQITAAEELYDYFTTTIATPSRVYAWGGVDGQAGQCATGAGPPDWVSGALAICCAIVRPGPQLRSRSGRRVRRPRTPGPGPEVGGLHLRGRGAPGAELALTAVARAAAGKPAQQAAVAFIAAIGQLPNASRTQSGATWESQIEANTEAVADLLTQSTVQRHELEQEVGGNSSGCGHRLRPSHRRRAARPTGRDQSGLTDRPVPGGTGLRSPHQPRPPTP